MLVLRKELNFYEFIDLFGYVLDDIGREGQAIIYDAICNMFYESEADETTIRDYLRYQMQVSSLNDVINDYALDIEDQEDDALVEVVDNYLNHNTCLWGTFEEDGETFFIFDEF